MSPSSGTPLIVAILAQAVLSGTPLFYAALGETLGQRAGIVNLGLEGLLLVGAATGWAVAAASGDPWWGLLAAAGAGGAANLLFAALVVSRRANQLASGLALMFLGIGVSALVGAPFSGAVVRGLPRWRPALLEALPGVGRSTLFQWSLLTWLAVPAALLVAGVLYRTRWGLRLRAVGESPAVAWAAGADPGALRHQALLAAGVLGGLAGGHHALSLTLSWSEYTTAGRGFIAIALVIFAKWDPVRLLAGALVFGGAEALQLQLQARGVGVSPFLLQMVPYLLTLAVLVAWGGARRLAAPASLGRTDSRSE